MAEVISKGVYTIPEAARLLRESPLTVRRWAFGYHGRGRNSYPPAIKTELPQVEGVRALIFLELVELMFIRGFLGAGASWKKIHAAAKLAAKLYHTEHPFAMKKWFADPAGIYTLMEPEHGEEVFLELSGEGQVAMRQMLELYLHQLEFDTDDIAQRWYPEGKDEPIVVDPRIAYGAPVIRGTAIRTATLYGLCLQMDAEEIAWWYELTEREVDTAIRFEQNIRVAALIFFSTRTYPKRSRMLFGCGANP